MPSVLANDLMAAFNTGATGVGHITTSFLYGYAFVQIPTGIVIDRLGCRKSLLLGMLTCSISLWFLQMSASVLQASTARVIMGIACGTAFIAPLTLARSLLQSFLLTYCWNHSITWVHRCHV